MISQPNLRDYQKEYAEFSWEKWHGEFSWHKTGKVNYAYEVTNYQVQKGNGEKQAIIFQSTDQKVNGITFKQLSNYTDILTSNLQAAGLKAGDRFALYAPKSIAYVYVLHAAVKCGAIVVPLFEAFGPDAIEDRLKDCGATWIYTTDKLLPNVPFSKIPTLKNILAADVKNNSVLGVNIFDLLENLKNQGNRLDIHFGDLETPFIIHYTSGSTAKPKGILLSQRAMIGHLVTAKYVLDLRPRDNYWNTGDPGWVTGMVYNFFAPLLLGVAAHILEGPFNPSSWIQFLAKRKITVWYSTPTAFRLLRYYQMPIHQAKSLRHIVSAGEPLNPSLIEWTTEKLGIPIHDSWYMTENGHQLINNYPCLPIRKGSMGKALPGIVAAILDNKAAELPPGTVGRLAIKTPWPGLMKTVWNNQKKFDSYFEKNWYISGDMAYQDKDGYFWFQGREDDMIKSGAERISPFEIESTLITHPAVAEAGVVGKPHHIYGNIVKSFLILKPNFSPTENLKTEIANFVKERLAAHEVPREIEFVEKLPKTKSGKIMRRVLRSWENHSALGDLSTLDTEMNPINQIIE